jgi:uncharacterized protein (DUF488 family)
MARVGRGKEDIASEAAASPDEDEQSILVCTIGHSNRPIEEFVSLLWSNGIARVIDVRTVPRSRHNPQFNLDTLPTTLESVGIAYTHLSGLGGLRRPRPDSPNAAWRNLSFRGYADYMQSDEFAQNVQRVVDLAAAGRCVLMCAEAVPWRCHRSLIGDALLVRGVRVEDIVGPHGRRPHVLTRFARVDGQRVTYPPSIETLAESRAGAGAGGAEAS